MGQSMAKARTVYLSMLLFTSGMLFQGTSLFGQSLSLNTSKTTFTKDSITYNGYVTTFEFEYDLIKKEWWRYIKRFAVLDHQKPYYLLSIPAKKGESNTPVTYISLTEEEEEETKVILKLALHTQGMNAEDRRKFSIQARELLVDFQLNFYLRHIQRDIDKKEKEASRLSTQVDRHNKRILALKEKLKSNKGDQVKISADISHSQKEKSRLSAELKALYAALDISKKRLKEIK